MKAKQSKKQSAQKAEPVKAKPVKKEESSSSDDDSSEEEEEPKAKVVAAAEPKKADTAKPVKMEVEESSSDDDSSSDEEAAPAKPQPKPVTPAKKAESSSEESSDDSSDEETKIPAKNGAATPQNKKAAPAKKEESSEEEDDDSSEEETAAKAKPVSTSTPAAAKKKQESSSEEEDSSDEEAPAAKTAAGAKNATKEDSDEDDDDDDDDEEEEDDDDEEKKGKKRMATEMKTPAKKAKFEVDETTGNELFVKNLPENAQEKKVQKFFEKQGIKVESIKLLSHKGICFVHLSEEVGSSAVEKLNGLEFDGNSLMVEIAKQRDNNATTPRGGDRAEKDKRTLFVRNLPWGTDEDSLAEHFAGCTDVRLPRNDDGKIRGIAFVEYESEAEVHKAIKEYNNVEFGGRALTVNQAGNFGGAGNNSFSGGNNSFNGGNQSNRNDERDKRSLFIGNLAYSADETSVGELFTGCSAVRVPRRDDGKIKGFAFVEYSSEAEATKAMKELQGQEIDGREISIERCSEKQGRGGGRGGRGGFDRGGRGGRGGFDRGGRGGRGGFDRGGRGGRGGFDRGGRGGFGGRGRGGRGGANSEVAQKNKGILMENKAARTVFDD